MNTKLHYFCKCFFTYWHYFYSIYYYYSCLYRPATSTWGITFRVMWLCSIWFCTYFFFKKYFYNDYKNSRAARIHLKKGMVVHGWRDTYYRILYVFECYKEPTSRPNYGKSFYYRYLVKAKIVRSRSIEDIGKETTTNLYAHDIERVSKLEEEMYK